MMIHCGLCEKDLKEGETWKEHRDSKEHQANLLDPLKRMKQMEKHIVGMEERLGE